MNGAMGSFLQILATAIFVLETFSTISNSTIILVQIRCISFWVQVLEHC
jgi:hypothetical protein